jgi:hypothetical protein
VTAAYLPKRGDWVIAVIVTVGFATVAGWAALWFLLVVPMGLVAGRVQERAYREALDAGDQHRGWCRACGQPVPPPQVNAPSLCDCCGDAPASHHQEDASVCDGCYAALSAPKGEDHG